MASCITLETTRFGQLLIAICQLLFAVLHAFGTKSLISQKVSAATIAEAGMVSTQAQTIRSTTIHFTPLKRLAAPTPMIEVEITCVVDSGMP